MKRYCLTLDLKNDPELIARYIEYHQQVWPEVIRSIRDSGILQMEIFHIHTRLFMIMEVDASFTFEKKRKMDADNPKVQEWETLMDQYQQRLPFAQTDEKWVLMEKIFEL
ncbi:L-rhamnose mutarotase [Fulvivirga ulvae]|uniref:L-rhamnose mutarotase n=1 Tax=Fulvivirga ulvae TaxID=2904245 RepID=UPI001F2493F0|nr:L-rhamnose mutarotase [Fulvivirga ulvae]UII34569.1 L-rhamnose mutarotase [Fulvivirga ulvae]